MNLTSGATLAKTAPAYRAEILFLIIILLLGIAALDRLTGTIPVHHLYYVPIILAAIWFRQTGGLLTACFSVVFYHLANPGLLQYGQRDLLQLAIFIGVGIVTAKLSADAARMRMLAHTDDLTGLHNLRSFEACYATLIRQASTDHTPLALLVLDLDHLKALNSQYGHLAGAQSIQTMGRIIAEQVPPHAVACRYGGDEFVIVIPQCNFDQAYALAHCLRTSVAQLAPVLAGHSLSAGILTTSIGVATMLPQPLQEPLLVGEQLFQLADQALYQAKAEGRNRDCGARQNKFTAAVFTTSQ